MSNNDPDCESLGIPGHLHSCKRKAENNISKDDIYYRRFNKPLLEDGKVCPTIFDLKDMSGNIGRFCEDPNDTLYSIKSSEHYFDYGVVKIRVEEIIGLRIDEEVMEKNAIQNVVGVYSFSVIHKPEKCMYPHGVVQNLKDGHIVEKIKPKLIKVLIRDMLRNLSDVVKEYSPS